MDRLPRPHRPNGCSPTTLLGTRKPRTWTIGPSYLPIEPLRELVAEGRLAALTERFHCAPTEYSQRRTREADAPEILQRCRKDGADVALLVPL